VLTFSEIASQLLKDLGYTPLECQNETEAITKAENRKETDKSKTVRFTRHHL